MKKNVMICLSLCLFILSRVTVNGQSELQAAKVEMQNGKYSEALAQINKHIAKNPSDVNAYLMLSEIQVKLGKYDLACATYGVVESMKLTDENFYLEYGKALKMMGRFDEAIVKFKLIKGENKSLAERQIKSCEQAKDVIKSSDGKRVMNLDINSSKSDYGAFPYNNTILYSSFNKPYMSENAMTTLEEYNNTYLCKALMNGSASALLTENNFIKNAEAISISDNNNMVAFSVVKTDDQNPLERMHFSNLMLGQFNGFGFENVASFPLNSDNYSIYSACITNGGNTLYFSSNMEGGFGGFDLYVSNLVDNQWEKPMNLGKEVNSTSDEITPYYLNGMLWFSSNKPNGNGGYDIYNGFASGDHFEDIKNIEQGVNTEANEYFPMVKNLVLYFTSDKNGGKGHADIYRAPLSSRNYMIELENDINPLVTQVNIEETPPPAFDMMASSIEKRSQNMDDDILSGARRVSLKEYVSKGKNPVYFIQLASMSVDNGNVDKFKSLVKYGNIYKVRVNNLTKVRLGYFMEKGETDVLLGKLRSSGYKDAFIVTDDLNNAQLELALTSSTPATIYDSKPTSNTKTNSTTKTSVTESNLKVKPNNNNFEYSKPLPISENKEYKVRLGSFEDPIWFDSKKVNDLGRVEQWTKGAWTIFILGGYVSYEEAEKARIQASNRGYADAEVVIDNGGIIERIKKN